LQRLGLSVTAGPWRVHRQLRVPVWVRAGPPLPVRPRGVLSPLLSLRTGPPIL